MNAGKLILVYQPSIDAKEIILTNEYIDPKEINKSISYPRFNLKLKT